MVTENLVLGLVFRAEEVKENPERLRNHLRFLTRKSRELSKKQLYELRRKLRVMEKGHWDAQTMSLAATLLFQLDCEYKRRMGIEIVIDLDLDEDSDLDLGLDDDDDDEEENNNNSNSSRRKRKRKKKNKRKKKKKRRFGSIRAVFKRLFRRRS